MLSKKFQNWQLSRSAKRVKKELAQNSEQATQLLYEHIQKLINSQKRAEAFQECSQLLFYLKDKKTDDYSYELEFIEALIFMLENFSDFVSDQDKHAYFTYAQSSVKKGYHLYSEQWEKVAIQVPLLAWKFYQSKGLLKETIKTALPLEQFLSKKLTAQASFNNQSYIQTLNALAESYRSLGYAQEACTFKAKEVTALGKMYIHAPSLEQAYYQAAMQLALDYHALGDTHEARKWRQKVEHLDPSHA